MWIDGRTLCLRGGGYDALRKQRSGFGARTLLGLPACLRLVDPEVERVLFAAGKTDPILGRTKKGEKRKEKEEIERKRKQIEVFLIARDDFSIAHTLKYMYV